MNISINNLNYNKPVFNGKKNIPLDELKHLIALGKSQKEIAKIYDTTPQLINIFMKEHGILSKRPHAFNRLEAYILELRKQGRSFKDIAEITGISAEIIQKRFDVFVTFRQDTQKAFNKECCERILKDYKEGKFISEIAKKYMITEEVVKKFLKVIPVQEKIKIIMGQQERKQAILDALKQGWRPEDIVNKFLDGYRVMFKELCKILKQEAVSSENAELALKIREKYVAGLSLNKIAELMHMSIYRVRKCLAADFFKDAKNERAKKYQESIITDVVQQGKSIKQLADEFGVHKETIYRRMGYKRKAWVLERREYKMKQLKQMLENNVLPEKIIQELDISRSTFDRWRKKL